jgi:uncharacterized protein (UPF0332 family)
MKKNNKKALTLSDENRLYLANSYREKALKSFDYAKDLLESKPDLSARMSYEAMYHFTAALFLCEGIQVPQTHRGVNSELYSNFVDTGLFSRDIAANLGDIERDRNTAQYDPVEKIFTDVAKRDLQKAEQFCKEIQKLVDERILGLERNFVLQKENFSGIKKQENNFSRTTDISLDRKKGTETQDCETGERLKKKTSILSETM